ncbi:fimbrial protein [Phytobacter ursingii]
MKLSRTLINIMVVLGLVISGSRVWAGCSISGNPKSFNASISRSNIALNVARNTPPGTAIGPLMSASGSGSMVSVFCSARLRAFAGYISSGLVESDIPGIYKTNVDGIGIKVLANGQTVTQTPVLYHTSNTGSGNFDGLSINSNITAQLYVIGPVNPTATNNKVQISNLQVGFWANDSTTPGGVRWGTLTINITTGVLNVLSCKTPNVTVPLGSHSASDFATVGATSAPVAFNIVVNECSKNMASVSYTLKPAAGISLVTKPFGQYLTLDSSSVASGVGVQVLKADGVTPVDYDVKYPASGYSTTAGGNFTIPLHARYIRTGTVSAGSANSAAEFVMSYE